MDVHFAEGEGIHVFLFGFDDDLIIHIGEVHHVTDVIAAVGEVTADDIKDQCRHGMADMRFGIDGRSADIHRNFSGLQCHKIIFFACKCVVNLDRHTKTPLMSGYGAFIGSAEDHSAGCSLQYLGHHNQNLFIHKFAAVFDNHHRAIVHVAHTLARFAAFLNDMH